VEVQLVASGAPRKPSAAIARVAEGLELGELVEKTIVIPQLGIATVFEGGVVFRDKDYAPILIHADGLDGQAIGLTKAVFDAAVDNNLGRVLKRTENASGRTYEFAHGVVHTERRDGGEFVVSVVKH
jgi:hypothetical protein